MRLSFLLISLVLILSCDARAGTVEIAPTARNTDATREKAACYAGAGTDRLRKPTGMDADYALSGRARVAAARAGKLATVKAMLAERGLSWPPRQVFLRGYKKENVLEVWASNSRRGPLTHVVTYEICYASGGPGPKTRQGDGQVPEGFYRLDYYKRNSDYFLAMRINYPNRRDRKLGHTGSAILIHGSCVSIGCLSMSDERIQELWLLASAAHRRRTPVRVHLFPTCDLDHTIQGAPSQELRAFWKTLKRGHDLFSKTKTVPRVGVNAKGSYTFPR